MNYAFEIGPGAMIYIPNFIEIGSGIGKILRGCTHRQHGDLLSLLLFSQNKESRVKIARGIPQDSRGTETVQQANLTLRASFMFDFCNDTPVKY
jgi:hypothetical protein